MSPSPSSISSSLISSSMRIETGKKQSTKLKLQLIIVEEVLTQDNAS